jgi:hypothetical protein
MRYQKIFSQIWFDEKFAALTPMQQRLYLYILTCPHGNLTGCFVLKSGYACADLKSLQKDFEKDLAKLVEMGLVKYCQTHELILIPNFLKYNPITNPNQKKAAIKLIKQMPKSQLLLHLKGLIKGLPEELWEGIREGVSKPETETETETELDLELNNKYIYKRYISSPSPPDEAQDAPPADIDSRKAKRKNTIPYQQIIDLWNKHAPQPLPRATLTEKRKPKIRTAWQEYPSLDWWKDLFSDIVYSPWHSHQDRWQGNSFDWMLKNRTEMREKLNALKARAEPAPRGPTMNADTDPPGIVIPSPDCPICRGGGLAPDGPCECLHPENPDDPYWTEHPEKLLEFKREKPI